MPTNDFLSPYGAVKYESGAAMRADVATIAALKALAATHPAHVGGNVVPCSLTGPSGSTTPPRRSPATTSSS
jgi:hypothetical protein